MIKNTRLRTRPVTIGTQTIGGDHRIALQSMTNTDTHDVAASVAQCERLIAAGADLVRITVPSMDYMEDIVEIKKKLRAKGMLTPIVADVHFFPKVAEACAREVEKVRINPGNYTDKRIFDYHEYTETEYQEGIDKMAEKARPLLEICRKHHTAIRVGVNHGSLCDRVVSRYGNTPEAMAMAAMEWVEICEAEGFQNMVLSMKASNPQVMIDSTLAVVDKMQQRGTVYPLHIGVTEAGNGMEGRAKSAVGIGTLLLAGIGDTVRVSLTEKPENELIFANKLIQSLDKVAAATYTISPDGVLKLCYPCDDTEELVAAAGTISGYELFLQKHPFQTLVIENPSLENDENEKVADCILQACRLKLDRAEFISCPSCGRTQYDIEKISGIVKERFARYAGVKIAIMGCVVNGPGEMADADFGVVGTAQGDLIVYKGKEKITSPLHIAEALAILEKEVIQSNKIRHQQ